MRTSRAVQLYVYMQSVMVLAVLHPCLVTRRPPRVCRAALRPIPVSLHHRLRALVSASMYSHRSRAPQEPLPLLRWCAVHVVPSHGCNCRRTASQTPSADTQYNSASDIFASLDRGQCVCACTCVMIDNRINSGMLQIVDDTNCQQLVSPHSFAMDDYKYSLYCALARLLSRRLVMRYKEGRTTYYRLCLASCTRSPCGAWNTQTYLHLRIQDPSATM